MNETQQKLERDAWLAERRQGIGGSDIAAILGLSPWKTAVSVWLDKTGQKADEPPTMAMMLGTELEDLVARLYAQENGRKVHRFTTMLHNGILLGNIDRLVIPEGKEMASFGKDIHTDTLLECKTSRNDWTDGVPLYYQTQVQHYMGLAPKIQHADVACLFLGPNRHFETYRVERDDEVIAYQQLKAEEFWMRYVENGEVPPPTNETDCKMLWARSNPGKTVEASAEIKAAVERLAALKAEASKLKADMEEIQSGICAAMGDGEILTDASGKPLVTWKSAKDTTKTDWRKVAEALNATQDIIDTFTTTAAGSRRFLIKA